MVGMRVGNYDIIKPFYSKAVEIAYRLTSLGVFAAVDKCIFSVIGNKLTVSLPYVDKMNGNFSLDYFAVCAVGESCPFV